MSLIFTNVVGVLESNPVGFGRAVVFTLDWVAAHHSCPKQVSILITFIHWKRKHEQSAKQLIGKMFGYFSPKYKSIPAFSKSFIRVTTGCGADPSCFIAKRQTTPKICHQSITGQYNWDTEGNDQMWTTTPAMALWPDGCRCVSLRNRFTECLWEEEHK